MIISFLQHECQCLFPFHPLQGDGFAEEQIPVLASNLPERGEGSSAKWVKKRITFNYLPIKSRKYYWGHTVSKILGRYHSRSCTWESPCHNYKGLWGCEQPGSILSSSAGARDVPGLGAASKTGDTKGSWPRSGVTASMEASSRMGHNGQDLARG